MTYYIKSILNKIEKKICILIFEGGGLYDEYTIINNAINQSSLYQKIDIYIIESMNIKTVHKAQNYFISILKKHRTIDNITIINTSFFLKEINHKEYDALIALSIDPYFFSIDYTFKSTLNDIKSYFTTYQFISISMLYLKKECIIWDIFLKNNFIYNNYILHQKLIGNKSFFYAIKQTKFSIK